MLCFYDVKNEIFTEVAFVLTASLNFKHIASHNRCEFISPTELRYACRGFGIVNT